MDWQRKTAIGAVFTVAAGALVAAAVAFGGPAAQEQHQPAAVETTTSTTPTLALVEVTQPAPGAEQAPVFDPVDEQVQVTAAKAPRQPAVVVQADEPVTTTAPPAPVTTTTTRAPRPTTGTATSSDGPGMPWCRTHEGSWYSGEGEGCTPSNPDFVEYR